jgi:hypothetical protein
MLKITELHSDGYALSLKELNINSIEELSKLETVELLLESFPESAILTRDPNFKLFSFAEKNKNFLYLYRAFCKDRQGIFIQWENFYDSFIWFIEFVGDDKDFVLLATLDHLIIDKSNFLLANKRLDASIFRNAIQTLRSAQHA